jgi:ubiquinone biosynthesis protein
VISSIPHVARLTRAAFIVAREGTFAVVDPEPLPGALRFLLRLARLIERNDAKSGPRLARALSRLGPTYVKLCQVLATRPDVIGVAMARDLVQLQDRLPPFSQKEAETIVAASLERPLTQAFASFGPSVAAASIAQVHRAEIEKDGVRQKPVAVKVLRPHIAARFGRDVDSLMFAARTLPRRAVCEALKSWRPCRVRSRWKWTCGLRRRHCPKWRKIPATIRIFAFLRSIGIAPAITC